MALANEIVSMAKKLAHPAGTPKKKWAYKTGAPRSVYKSALKKYCRRTARIAQSDCGYFVNTVVRMAGIDSKFIALSSVSKPFPKAKKFKIVYKGKKIPRSVLKAGDIIRYKSKTGQHVLIYMGNGYIAEAGRGRRFPIIRKSRKYNGASVKKNTIQVLRTIE